jgi:hypothetical protein
VINTFPCAQIVLTNNISAQMQIHIPIRDFMSTSYIFAMHIAMVSYASERGQTKLSTLTAKGRNTGEILNI